MREDLAEDTPSLHRAAETLAVATRSQRRHAETSIAGMPMAVVVPITAVAGITAAEDIMAPVLDSVSAFTRLTDMPLRFAIPPGSMMHTACGATIRVARCRTDIELEGGPHSLRPTSRYLTT